MCCGQKAFAQCEADAGPGVTICAGESVQIGGNPTAFDACPGVNYNWDNDATLDDGSASNPFASPTVTTTYTVTLTSCGCGGVTSSMTVTVLNAPNVAFTFAPNSQCANTPVVFNSTASACPSCDYDWDFDNPASGGANSSTIADPTHTFITNGSGTVTFDVSVTVTALNGCTDTFTDNIQIDNIPNPVLSDPITTFQQCSGEDDFLLTIYDASTPATNANYSIDWESDGTADWTGATAPQGVAYTYNGVGVYEITYTITGTNGCSNSATFDVFNVTNPGVGVGSDGSTTACGPVEFCFNLSNYELNHASTIYTIDFGDGSPTLTIDHPSLLAEYCHTYTESSCPDNWYTFTITATNGCASSVATLSPVKVGAPPAASFYATPQPACAGSSVTMVNTSFNGYGLVNCNSNAAYSWNFGDPGSGAANTAIGANLGNQSHVYANPGTYTVTLTLTNPCGTSTATQIVCIETAPTPVFTVNSNLGCVPMVVTTDNTSNNGVPCSVSTVWNVTYSDLPCDPDNGAYSNSGGTALEPQFTLSSVGTYTINLQMQNSCGIFNDYESVTVNTVPVVSLTSLSTICAGGSTSPSATVDPCNLSPVTYAWTFPGGSPATSSSANPGAITYATAGTNSVGLTASNACGPASSSTGIVVNPIPTAGITTTASNNDICAGQTFSLTGTGATSYTWTGNGLSSGTGTTVNVTTSTTGTYVVTASNGTCSDTEQLTITVDPLPIPTAAGTYTICIGQSVVIGANTAGGEAPYSGWSWTPTATLTGANTQNPTATPLVTGTNNYTVSVTDNNGCTGSGTVPVVVNALPVVNAGVDLTLCDQPVATTLTGYSPAGGLWSGTNVTPAGVFTPSGTGTFTLTYTYTNASGCVNSDNMNVTVIAPTTANAGPDLEFCASTTPVAIVPVTPGGTWSGTNITSGGSFTPNTPNTYTLTYTLGVGSCQTTDPITVVVHPLPVVNAGSDQAMCAGSNVQLNGGVSGGETPYGTPSWNNAGTLSASNVLNPTATPASSTTYTLTVSDNNNCTSNDAVLITVSSLPVVNAGPDIALCNQPIPATLTGYSPAGGTWSGANVTLAGVYTPNGVGSFVLTYTFTNASGCTNSDVITVNVADATPANAGPDDDICLNTASVQLAVGGTWSGSPLVTAGGLFTPLTVGIYTLTYTIGTATCQTSDQMVMEVLTLPVADAGPDQTICSGDVVQLGAAGSSPNGGLILFSWSGGTVSNSLIPNPTATPNITTTYNILIVDSTNCSDPDQVTIFVNQLPVVNAGNNLTLCDQNIVEQLTGFTPTTGPGGIGAWSGPGVTPTGAFTSPGAGVYNLTYTFTDNTGCDNSDNITVTVNVPVIASAGPDVTLCQNEGVFLPSGYVPATGGTWSGTGITNAATGLFNPIVSGTGSFTITLQYGSGTCYTSDQIQITVLAPPAVAAGPNQSVCGNLDPFNLTGFSPASGGIWEGTGIINAGLGTFDPGIGTGTYNLLYWYMDSGTGCADTAFKTVTVHPVPVANFTLAPLGCTNSNIDVINTSSGATNYAWDFGNGFTANGIDPPYTYPDEGIFDVEVVATNAFGCADTAMNSNEIIDPPTAILNLLPADGCAPLTVSFENLSIGQYLTYVWDLTIGSSSDPVPAPVIYYQDADDISYPITLTATNFCGSDVADDEVTVYPQPVAGFGTNLDVFCSPFTVVFNNISVGNPDYFLWEFGDGSTSSLEEPGTHVFFADTIPVDYNIWLFLENECGIDSSDYIITVLPNTVTAFFNTNVIEGCSPLTVEFTDISEGGTVIQYQFGDDGPFTTNPNPTYTFIDAGFYTVHQYVDNGCSFDTTEITIEVFESPVIDFTTDVVNLCANESVQFDADPGNSISLTWDFDDGGTSDLSDPTHQYLISGSYDVELTGTSLNGCTSSITHPVNVYDAPDASFTIPDQVGCSPFTIAFSNSTNGGLFYEWDFGDGNTDIDEDPSNTYYNVGSDPVLYTVTLIVENIQLCADTFEMDVIVSPQPTSAFVLSSFEACYFPQDVSVTNFSLDATSYEWLVDGTFYSDITTPVLNFPDVGEYDVELVTSNQYGCTASSNAEYNIYPLPTAELSATPLDGCVDLLVDFINTSSGAQSYLWNFGDGSTSVSSTPQHEYDSPGIYDITLIATTDFGCSDTLMVDDYVEVYNLPIADFDFDPHVTTIYQPVISFYDDSYDAYQWAWEFGDGIEATQPNVQHTYSASGIWPVALTVWNEHGCVDNKNDVVVIDDLFNIYVPNAFTPDDDDINEYFRPVMSGTAFIERYKFQIFDRWGTVIFETENPEEAWTGNVRDGGYFAKDDAYNWQVIVQLHGSDEERLYFGHVVLFR